MALPATIRLDSTTIVQAYYNGRTLGRADVTVATNGAVTINWSRQNPLTGLTPDPVVAGVINTYATDPAYLALVNTPVGYSAVDLGRSNTSDI